ncbi:hypothetical protein Pint_13490 [Pistacia integerrima]|uniref:Uncharacterized protein n=1 Tax=Pistacia integerrima TaxID=434235 RepID=A0ACC0Y6X2_9ROSI|nr:hypothetical protein Pint_13490 [Pistacia integerrima]
MSLFGLGSRNQRTFRPKKNAPSGSKGAQLQKHIDVTLGSGNLREAVRLPPGEDINEWLAVNSKDFNIWVSRLQVFCSHHGKFCVNLSFSICFGNLLPQINIQMSLK